MYIKFETLSFSEFIWTRCRLRRFRQHVLRIVRCKSLAVLIVLVQHCWADTLLFYPPFPFCFSFWVLLVFGGFYFFIIGAVFTTGKAGGAQAASLRGGAFYIFLISSVSLGCTREFSY